MNSTQKDELARRELLAQALEISARYVAREFPDDWHEVQDAAAPFYASLGLPNERFWNEVPAGTPDEDIAALLDRWVSLAGTDSRAWERSIDLAVSWIDSGIDLRRIRVALLFTPFYTVDLPVLRTHLDTIETRFPILQVQCQSTWAQRLGSDFVSAAANTLIPEMKRLLKAGAQIDWCGQPYFKATALNTAAGHGLTRSVKFLIEQGADLNSRNYYDLTPLMKACFKGGKKGSAVAMLLINAGADVHAVREADGKTALQLAVACCEPEMVEALEQRGATLPKESFRVLRRVGDKVAILDFTPEE